MDTIKGLIVGLVIVAVYIIVIGFCIYLILSQELTVTETSLISIIISICSILTTWIVGHLYSGTQHKKAIQDVQEFHRTNLQTYAKKAAEKVNNLSEELARLAIYLSDELDRSDSDDPNELLHSREERILSTVHMIQTLKSVNDTALSDWEGVIGDLLDQQREEKEEKKEELIELLDRVENVVEERFDERYGDHYDRMQIREEIESLRKDLRYVARNLAITQVPIRRKVRKQKHDVNISCPKCGEEVNYRQRATTKGYKGVVCKACDTKYISRYIEDEGFTVEERQLRVETINCPECDDEVRVELDTLPCSSIQIECGQCGEQIRVSRTIEGTISTKGMSNKDSQPQPKAKLTDEIVEKVKDKLPAQPWPKRVHALVATELELPSSIVCRAIDQLIRTGVFKPQINGTLYVPEITNTEKKATSTKNTVKKTKKEDEV